MTTGKKPLHHPDYEIWPGAFNFSKWSRENEPKPPPSYAVGDVVRLTTVTQIVKVYQDCDGTPLYQVKCNGYGLAEDQLAPTTDEEKAVY